MLTGGPQLLNAYGSLVVVQRHSSQSRVEHAPHYRSPAAAAVANDRDRYIIIVVVDVVRSRVARREKRAARPTFPIHFDRDGFVILTNNVVPTHTLS